MPYRCVVLTWGQMHAGKITATVGYLTLERQTGDSPRSGECICCERPWKIRRKRRGRYDNCARCRTECVCPACQYSVKGGIKVCGGCLSQKERDIDDDKENHRLHLLRPWKFRDVPYVSDIDSEGGPDTDGSSDEDRELNEIRIVRRFTINLRPRPRPGTATFAAEAASMEEVD